MSSTSPRSTAARELLDLLASMRFSISLLSVICIASVIGTVVKQREPANNYVNQFGPFWAELFGKLDLYTVYGAWWFLLILAFLVISTSLCIARNTPKILADLRNYKEGVREQSLSAHRHKAIGELHSAPAMALAEIGKTLTALGWKARVQQREHGIMIAARQGAANKIGYIAAHSAIVLVCLGGLLDGDLMVRGLMWAQGKTLYSGAGLVADVKPEHRLAASNPSFRGNLYVPEKARSGTAVLSLPSGVVLQDLPFEVELRKFNVEYYSTGMPKSFASEIVIRDLDRASAPPREAVVKVNEPVIHRGVAIYQSSFEDGGSRIKLRGIPLAGGTGASITGRIGESTSLGEQTLEFAGLRVINVENLSGEGSGSVDVRKVDLKASLDGHLGSGAKTRSQKDLRNVGPSVSYKLRDASGQAREYNNYMLPVELDGQRVFLAGVRDSPAESFRYLRMPADEDLSLEGWLRLRRALLDPELRAAAAQRYASGATPADRPAMTPQLQATAGRALALFAGLEAKGDVAGGLPALSAFIEGEVPQDERNKVSEVLLRILNGSLYELHKLARERAGLPALAADAAAQAFMTQSVLALSDSFYYPAPQILQLDDFEQVQASVFQVARAPGQKLVYLGAVLLIIGVFAMLYIKERRLWVWIAPSPEPGGSQVRMALSSTRESPDNAALFEQLRREVLKESA